MKKISAVALLIIALVFIQCEQKPKDTTFTITKSSIGKLDKSSLTRDLEIIYEQDSIVKDTARLLVGFGAKKIDIFEKGGNHLLTLTPSSDSIPTIENVRIQDARFRTEMGIGLNSTFKDIKDKYELGKILTSTKNVVVFIKHSDMYFTIDKEELPSSLRYVSSVNIEAVQIPDDAQIKYMMLGWE
jgi:ubiquitin